MSRLSDFRKTSTDSAVGASGGLDYHDVRLRRSSSRPFVLFVAALVALTAAVGALLHWCAHAPWPGSFAVGFLPALYWSLKAFVSHKDFQPKASKNDGWGGHASLRFGKRG
jgi:fatty acid desaturase